MDKYTYIIIGGGMAADSAVEGIREVDQSGSILLISAERVPPYDRPPLSKSLWKNSPVEEIWRHTAKKRAEIFLNTKAYSINPMLKEVTDNFGHSYQYQKMLLIFLIKIKMQFLIKIIELLIHGLYSFIAGCWCGCW